MARYPGVAWQASPNFRAGPTVKVRLVLHRMAGAYAGGLSWLTDPRSKVSANFAVENVSGQARQLVDTADIAWAQANYNPDSISIEIGGLPEDPVSDAAWATITNIVRQAHEIDGIVLVLAVGPDFHGLAYHGQLGSAGGGHPDCPGAIVIARRPWILQQLQGGPPTPAAAAPTTAQRGDLVMLSTPDPKLAIAVVPRDAGGEWVFFQDGSVHSNAGAVYYGCYLGEGKPQAGIGVFTDAKARPGADGYTLLRQDGGTYHYGADLFAAYKASGGK